MANAKQRTILRAAAAIAIVAFVIQPKVTEHGFPMGFHLFWATMDFRDGQSSWTALYPDYKALATEFVVLWTVALALCVVVGPKASEE